MDYLINNEFISSSVRNEIAILTLKGRIFDLVTNLDESDHLLDFIYASEKDHFVKALLLINEIGSLGEKQYDEFLERIIAPGARLNDCDPPTILNKKDRFREVNILNRIIMALSNYQKLCVVGVQDNLVTPFIGLVMASDIRYMAENAWFSMAHNKYGLHPTGGLPYFLSRQLGYPTAMELLFTDTIPASKALSIQLINKTLPSDQFLEHCISETRKFTRHRLCTIRNTKRLSNFDRWALTEYFEFEAGLLNL